MSKRSFRLHFTPEDEASSQSNQPVTVPDDGAGRDEVAEPDAYDAGLLSGYGGGDVEWWQDYIRAELGRAHDFYVSQWPASALSAERAAHEQTRRELEAVTAKVHSLSAHETCACSYDRPGDICDHHSPQLSAERAEVARLRKALEPFAAVADYDVSDAEDDGDIFRPASAYNKAPLITIGDLRRARDAARSSREEGK